MADSQRKGGGFFPGCTVPESFPPFLSSLDTFVVDWRRGAAKHLIAWRYQHRQPAATRLLYHWRATSDARQVEAADGCIGVEPLKEGPILE